MDSLIRLNCDLRKQVIENHKVSVLPPFRLLVDRNRAEVGEVARAGLIGNRNHVVAREAAVLERGEVHLVHHRAQLVGAALAWTVDGGEVQLSEAVTMRVLRPTIMGITPDDWNGIFWAGVLLLVTISLLCAAVRSDGNDEDFCCE